MTAFKAMFSEGASRPTSKLVFGSRPVAYIIAKDCLYFATRNWINNFTNILSSSRRTVGLEHPKLSLDHKLTAALGTG